MDAARLPPRLRRRRHRQVMVAFRSAKGRGEKNPMITKLRMCFAGIVLAAVIGLICLSEPSQAAQDKDLNSVVVKIADAIKKGDNDAAKKMAAAAVEDKKLVEQINDIMHMFKPRNKGGMGVGLKPLMNPAKDGIEVALRDLGRDVPAGVAKQAEALETTGYWIAAIAELSIAKGWEKDSGKKTKKRWTEGTEDMRKLGIDFAKAAAGKGGQQIK